MSNPTDPFDSLINPISRDVGETNRLVTIRDDSPMANPSLTHMEMADDLETAVSIIMVNLFHLYKLREVDSGLIVTLDHGEEPLFDPNLRANGKNPYKDQELPTTLAKLAGFIEKERQLWVGRPMTPFRRQFHIGDVKYWS